MADLNKLLGWKQALTFFAGIILVIIGIGFLLSANTIFSILGVVVNLSGFALLVINLKTTLSNKDVSSGARTALFVPKIIFFVILLIISASFYFTAFM